MSQYYCKAKCNRLVGTDEPYEEVTPFRVLSLYCVRELDFDDCLEVMVLRTKDNVNQNGSYTLTTEATNRWGRISREDYALYARQSDPVDGWVTFRSWEGFDQRVHDVTVDL